MSPVCITSCDGNSSVVCGPHSVPRFHQKMLQPNLSLLSFLSWQNLDPPELHVPIRLTEPEFPRLSALAKIAIAQLTVLSVPVKMADYEFTVIFVPLFCPLHHPPPGHLGASRSRSWRAYVIIMFCVSWTFHGFLSSYFLSHFCSHFVVLLFIGPLLIVSPGVL